MNLILQLISNYLNYLEIERGLSKNTILAYENDLVGFFKFLENERQDIDIHDIKRKDFSNYTKYLAKNELNPSSITRKIASIKGFFKYLCFNRDIKSNPAVSVVSPKLPKKLPKVLSISEVDKILKHGLNPLENAIIELLYSAGIRVSELTGLQIKNADLNQKMIKVLEKVLRSGLSRLTKNVSKQLKNILNKEN